MKKLVLPLAAVLALAACGGDDEESTGTEAPAVTEASEGTTAPAETAGADTTAASEDTEAADTTEATDETEAAETTEETEAAETTEATEETEAAETTEATEDTEAADTTEATDSSSATSTGDTTGGSAAGGTIDPATCGPDADVWFEPGTLTVATGEPAFPPYVIDDTPESGEGFESAVVYAVAERLGFSADQVTWVRTGFDEAIAPGEKDYDFNIQQYGITADRDEVVDFSLPYYVDQKTVVALNDSPAIGATTFADLEGIRWGATIGTTDYDYIVNDLGVAEDDVAVYDDQAATFAALSAGQIDATVIGLPTALYQTGVELDNASIVGLLPRDDANSEGAGMLFTEGNPARDCVDLALTELTDDGTLAALDEEWMQGGGEIPEITE